MTPQVRQDCVNGRKDRLDGQKTMITMAEKELVHAYL